MSAADCVELLRQSVVHARRLAGWLERSFCAVAAVDLTVPLSPEHADAFEALAGRFARLCDLLLKRVFRSLDAVELEDEGTVLDALNRAEKRGVVPSAGWFREVRELRNVIAHEYAEEDLHQLFGAIRNRVPGLLETVRKVSEYSVRHTGVEGES